MADPKPSEGSEDIFTYVDREGHTFITDSLEAIPEEYRKLAKKASVDEAKKALATLEKQVEKAKKESAGTAKEVQKEVGGVLPFVKDLDLPSVAFGFGFALALMVVASFVRRTGRVLVKVGLVVAVVVLVTGSYFAWLRRAAGLGDTKLASPKAMIDDARGAARAMEKRLTEQKRLLDKIEKTSR